MGIDGRLEFSWPIWLGVAALAGFLAALAAIVGVSIASSLELLPQSDLLLERQVATLCLSVVLSLPALANQVLMRQVGLDAGFYYAATAFGGWIALGAAVEGAIIADEYELGVSLVGSENELAAFVSGLFLGTILTAFLQSFALPRSVRAFYCVLAAPGALIGIAVAVGILIGLLGLFRGDPFWSAAFAVAVGWACIAATTGWPVRRAAGRLTPASV